LRQCAEKHMIMKDVVTAINHCSVKNNIRPISHVLDDNSQVRTNGRIVSWTWLVLTLEHILLEAARSDRKALSERERKYYTRSTCSLSLSLRTPFQHIETSTTNRVRSERESMYYAYSAFSLVLIMLSDSTACCLQ